MSNVLAMPDRPPPNELTAADAAAAIARGELSSVALVESCLERIETRDALVSAWTYALVVDKEEPAEYAKKWVSENTEIVNKWLGL